MYTKIAIVFAVAILLSACGTSSSTTKQEKAAADFEQTAQLIESGNYLYTVRSATPSGGKTIQITSDYNLKAKDGKFEALLPYFGRSYSASYGGSQSVEFSGDPEDLQITRNDKRNNIVVTFNIASGAEKYNVKLEVGASAYGNMVVSNPKKQAVSYYGLVSSLRD